MQHLLLGNTKQTANGVTTRPGPTLDLNFAASLNCIDQVSGRDLVSFTRTTSGTYFDSAGVLRSAAVNLLVRSEEFNDAAWSKISCTIAANTATAPDGTVTADQQTHTGNGPRVTITVSGATASAVYTLSFYAKRETSSFASVSIYDNTITGNRFWFNLLTGQVGTKTNINTGYPSSSHSIQPVGDNWYRCVVTFTNTSSSTITVDGISVVGNADGALTPSTSGLTGLVWGAQLQTGSVATAYIPTTSTVNSAPRFDHNPITLESLGLLVEEPRTNSIRNNTMVGAVAGTPGTAPTNWSGNATTAGITRQIVGTGIEDGIAYIDYRIAGTTTGALFFSIGPELSTAVAATNGQTWTFSSYARVVAGSFANFTQLNYYIVFNNSGGTGVQFVTGGITPTSAPLKTQRFVRVATATNATIAFVQPAFQFEALTGAVIDVTLRIGLPQLENAAFASSVIPTSTGTFTRSADIAAITGTNFSSWYRQSEGTVLVEYRDHGVSGTNRTPYVLSDGTGNNRIQLFLNGTTVINNRHVAAGINTNPNVLSASLNAKNRHAITSAVGSCTAASNGTLSNTTTPAAMPTINRLNIGINSEGTGDYLNSHVARITYYPVRIPNSLLQAITV